MNGSRNRRRCPERQRDPHTGWDPTSNSEGEGRVLLLGRFKEARPAVDLLHDEPETLEESLNHGSRVPENTFSPISTSVPHKTSTRGRQPFRILQTLLPITPTPYPFVGLKWRQMPGRAG